MRKFRLYYDKDKEEVWLNQMCSKGWEMTSFFLGIYTFKPCEPGKYTYQIDMPKMPKGYQEREVKKREYIEFVESTGAEYVCSWGFYVIFRKETSKGVFHLYTDVESKIGLYQRIRFLFLLIFLYDIWACMFNTHNFARFVDKYWAYSNGNILNLEGIWLWIPMLGILYVILMVFFCTIVRISLKIHRLKQEQ